MARDLTLASGQSGSVFTRKFFSNPYKHTGKIVATNKSNVESEIGNVYIYESGVSAVIPSSYVTADNLPATLKVYTTSGGVDTLVQEINLTLESTGTGGETTGPVSWNDITDKPVGNKTVNTKTASFTLSEADAQAVVVVNSSSATTLTVPTNATVGFPVGTVIEGVQAGSGQVTIAPASGVTVNAVPGLKVAAQYGTFGLIKTGTDTWLAFGRLSA